jgi:cysteine desulfurase/selenocysteine lyase
VRLFSEPERRRLFQVVSHVNYLNAASECPWPDPTITAVTNWARRYGETDIRHTDELIAILSRLRELCADLIGADADEIAFVPNTSAGLAIAAELLPLSEGDEIIIPNGEFPAVPTAWARAERRGVRVVRADISERGLQAGDIENACTERSRAVCLSWVAYDNGDVRNLDGIREIVEKRRLYFVVDGIQATGVRPIDVHDLGIDVFASGGSKWLMSPCGSGLVYIRRELSRSLPSPSPGWLAYDFDYDWSRCHETDLPLYEGARRYEQGSWSQLALIGMHASLDLICSTGVSRIFEHVTGLVKTLATRLAAIPDIALACDPIAQEANFLAFGHPRAKEIFESLTEKRIIVSFRNDRVRLAPHLYSTGTDIEEAIKTIERFRAV